MNVPVLNMAGEEVNSVDLPVSVFEANINRGLDAPGFGAAIGQCSVRDA